MSSSRPFTYGGRTGERVSSSTTGTSSSSRPSGGMSGTGMSSSSRTSMSGGMSSSSRPTGGMSSSSRPTGGMSSSSRPTGGMSSSSRPTGGMSSSGRPTGGMSSSMSSSGRPSSGVSGGTHPLQKLGSSSPAAPSGSPSRTGASSSSQSDFLRGGSSTSRPTSSSSQSDFLRSGSPSSRPTSGATSYSSSASRPTSSYGQAQPSSARPSSSYSRPSSTRPGEFFKQSVPDMQRRFERGVSLDKQQFMDFLREVGPEYEPIGAKLFEAFDKDRNGRLNAHELTGGMTLLAGSVNKADKMNLMFDLYDRNRSGTISRAEMSEFMQSMHLLAVQFVDDQVKDLSNLLVGVGRQQLGNSNSILSDMQRQLRRKLENHTQMIVERAFGEGRSRGGELSKSEFTRWAQTQPKMFKWLTDLGKKIQNRMKKEEAKRYDDSPVRRQLKNVTHEEVRQITQQVVRGKIMRQADIREVLGRLNLKNEHLMNRVISVFDRDQRGEVETHEFFSSMAMLCSNSNSRDKLEFAFRMFDSDGRGSLSRSDVESFVNNFFKMAKSNIRKLIRGVNELFPGAHGDEDRQFGRSIQQLTDTRIKEFVSNAVDDAMRYGQGGRSLDQRGFMQWCGQMDGMSKYLEEVGARWLDSIEDDFLEGVEDSHQWDANSDWRNDSDRLSTSFDRSYSDINDIRSSPSRSQQDQQASSFFDSARDRSSPSRSQQDRQASSFFDSARDRPRDDYDRSRDANPHRGPNDSGGWKFSRDDYPRRYQKHVQNRKRTRRPKAQWHKNDHLRFLKNWDIRKISEVFMREARGGAMTYQMFSNGMQRLGVRNEAIARGMFDAFDTNSDGSLALEEFTSGIQVLTTGSYREKVRLAFEVFDRRRTGRISRSDLQQYLKSFYRVAKETITRVTATTADVFGVTSKDQQVLSTGGQERQSFGTEFAQGMDRHLKKIIDKMTDEAFKHARDGYEGGGNLSLPDFERWAESQPNLIAWYEHLGDHWLSAIHHSSRSPIQSYRSQRQIGLRRAFQEMDLAGMLRDVQRRQGNWYDMDKRDFEDMMRQHVRTPSMGVVEKLFSAFDIEDRGKVDSREVLSGMCCLAIGSNGGQSDHRQFRIIFDMFDKDRNGLINRQEISTAFRAFFMLAYDVVHNSLLNCSELFGDAAEFVNACWDQVNRQTQQVLDRVVDTIFRSAAGGKGDLNWSDFERWESRDNSLVAWMAKVADLWCTSIVDDDSLFPQLEEDPRSRDHYPEESQPYPNKEYDDYYDHYDNVQRGYGKKKKNKYRPPYFLSGPLAPVPGGLGAMGYPYQSYLKKIFSITLISHRTNHKKFTYRNPYAKRTCFSLHSSNPNIIEIKQPQLVIPPNMEKFARLTFHPASPGNSECLLYIHNDDADRNEECIRFDLSYMKDATNPYDKFAGLYGAKTYWGYDGADTGEDPFEARMWDNRQPAHARPPKQWDGYVPDHGGFDDRRSDPRADTKTGKTSQRDDSHRRENDFFGAAKEASFFDEGRRRSQEFARPASPMRQAPQSPQDKFFADGRARSSGTSAYQDRPTDNAKAFLDSGRNPAPRTTGGSSNAFLSGSSSDARARSFLNSGR